MSDSATATPEAQESSTATQAPAKPARKAAPARRSDAKPADPRRLPPYHVVLLNDEEHTYHYVIELLMKVFGHSPEKAFLLTQQIDEQDRAAVWTGQKEVAEFKRDQVRGYGPDVYASRDVTFPLGVTIEPVE